MVIDKKNIIDISINLTSLVNSHEEPFIVIDKNYQIVAINKAYQQHYGNDGSAVGKVCYQAIHGRRRPCHLEGQECPHQHVFSTGKATVCKHIHYDSRHFLHQVKVSATPLYSTINECLLGESIEDIGPTHIVDSEGRMAGHSVTFKQFVEKLSIAASSDAPVLLQGETGTGKELAAEFIHAYSARSGKPFQLIDCTVLTENLFESEMFGHVEGAFTGSTGKKKGLLELTDGGTVFLDEIAELTISQQAKLLRVLETGKYRSVGGENIYQADFRFICASNKDLWKAVKAGTFREDLYYRIACLNIQVPPLRHRLNDITELSQVLLDTINHSMYTRYYLTNNAQQRLKQYHYPGNIRELRNILFIAATQSQKSSIDEHLVDRVIACLPHLNTTTSVDNKNRVTINTNAVQVVSNNKKSEKIISLKDLEIQHIKSQLKKYNGNRRQTATALGICDRTMYRKLKEFNLS